MLHLLFPEEINSSNSYLADSLISPQHTTEYTSNMSVASTVDSTWYEKTDPDGKPQIQVRRRSIIEDIDAKKDAFGARSKVDQKEIALVRKIDWRMMVS
jgi:hypothetical protein